LERITVLPSERKEIKDRERKYKGKGSLGIGFMAVGIHGYSDLQVGNFWNCLIEERNPLD
jgi:hypothetical protein